MYFKLKIFTLLLILLMTLSCTKDNKIIENQAVIQTKEIKKYDSIPLNIFEGVGVENIKLGMIDNGKVINLKSIQFSVDTGEGISCGDESSCHTFLKEYTNKKRNISIKFESECFPEPNIPTTYKRVLNTISISNNKAAKLQNGLCIGVSTYVDVIKMYAPIPKHWVNESYLSFDKKGVSFRFDDKSILTEIEVFKPK